MHIGRIDQCAKQIAQFSIRIKGQRVFAFGPVQADGGHMVLHAELEMLRLVVLQGMVVAGQLLGLTGQVFRAHGFSLRGLLRVGRGLAVFKVPKSVANWLCSLVERGDKSSRTQAWWAWAMVANALRPAPVKVRR